MLIILPQFFTPITKVLSAYQRCEKLSSPLLNLYMEKLPSSTALFIKRLKPSTTRRKRKGNRSSSYISPLPRLNSFVGLPFTNTKTDDVFKHFEIQHLSHRTIQEVPIHWVISKSFFLRFAPPRLHLQLRYHQEFVNLK